MPIRPSSTFLIRLIFPMACSCSLVVVPANAQWIIYISTCSFAMRWDNKICCPAKNSMASSTVELQPSHELMGHIQNLRIKL